MSEAVVTSYNKQRRDLALLAAGRISHLAPTAVVASANASSEATFATLAADLQAALVAHAASVIAVDGSGTGSHLAAVAIPAAATASPMGIATALRDAFNAHIESEVAHIRRDSATR